MKHQWTWDSVPDLNEAAKTIDLMIEHLANNRDLPVSLAQTDQIFNSFRDGQERRWIELYFRGQVQDEIVWFRWPGYLKGEDNGTGQGHDGGNAIEIQDPQYSKLAGELLDLAQKRHPEMHVVVDLVVA